MGESGFSLRSSHDRSRSALRPASVVLLRGSILQRIRWTLLFNTLLATAVTLAHGNLFTFKITLTPIPFALMGLPLAIFLGFRNTTAYDR